MDCSLSGSSVHGDSPGKNTGVGCHAFLQEISPTQGLNLRLLNCRQILYQLNHLETLAKYTNIKPSYLGRWKIPFKTMDTLTPSVVMGNS